MEHDKIFWRGIGDFSNVLVSRDLDDSSVLDFLSFGLEFSDSACIELFGELVIFELILKVFKLV